MERYDLEQKISSCLVNKSLISQIENYMTKRLSKKLQGILSSDSELNTDYTVKIKDSIGEEYLSSIGEYHREKFPNDIKELDLSYLIDINSVNIRVCFSNEVLFSKATVDIKCEGAKEVALGIIYEINEIIKENKTIHYIFYEKFALIVFCTLIISVTTLPLFELPYSKHLQFFFVLIGVAYLLIRQISPYASFDTKINEGREKFSTWLTNGMAGVFVFGLLAVFIRDYFF
jgi:hypothetical protein